MAAVRARLASGNPHKLEELRAALPGWELELLETEREYPPEDGDDLLRERPREGGVRTGVGGGGVGARRGLRDRGRGTRRPRPGSHRPAGPPTASPSCSSSSTASTTVARATSASSSRSAPTARSCAARGSSRARSRPSGAATRASATTRSSSRPARTRTVAQLGDDWKRTNSHRARAAAALAATMS